MTRIDGVAVLGMHRAGTSAVTRVLGRMGLAVSRPEDSVRGPWNPAGHFESRRLMHLDDELLSQMGCAWWHPPPADLAYPAFAARIRTSGRQARRTFRRAYPHRDWAWKDPRACVLLPFWRRALSDRVAAVIVLRNPLDVAESLQRRNDTSTQFGVALWARYMRLVAGHASGMPVLVTRFEDLLADPAGWTQSTARFLGALGLRVEADPRNVAASVDPGLRHSRNRPDELRLRTPWATSLYDRLLGMRGPWMSFSAPQLGPEPADVQAALDALSADTPPSWRPPADGSATSVQKSASE
jgi:hypothetical protein